MSFTGLGQSVLGETVPSGGSQQQQQHKLYLHDYNYVVTVLQKL